MSQVRRRHFLIAAAGLAALCLPAVAQQPTKIPRIGFLSTNSLSAIPARVAAFRQGLRELGYVEGKNIVIEYRGAEGKPERLPALAAELVRLKVDAIVTSASESNHAAKDATATIPIVMAQDRDPVGNGFVASLAHPGGNITGLSALAPELSGKQLELLKKIVPRLSRVAVLGTSTTAGTAQSLREVKLAAEALRVKLQYLDVRSPNDIETAFRAAGKGHAGAVLTLPGPFFVLQRTQLVDLAAKSRLPAMYSVSDFMDAGGLIFYGPSITDLFHRAAYFVDKILKGTKPADIPVEQPTKFELVVNMKTAKAMGLTIPQSVLLQATRVIE